MAASLYIHVPFCASRCGYCGFYAVTSGDREGYTDALLRQLEAEQHRLMDGPLPSIYVGGGTPSWLPGEQLDRLFAALAPRLGPATEFSIECNPEDLDATLLARLERGGVTRLSLGIQSLDDDELRAAGRRHDAAGARRAIALATGSSLRLSLDLIAGLPAQSPEGFRASLDAVIAAEPEHVSLYCLELDDDVPMARQFAERPDEDPGDSFRADRYLEAHAQLAAGGYVAYEVSNWSRGPGRECRHNLAIWRGGEFLGLGPAAHSRIGGRRWSWCADLAQWREALRAGREVPRQEDRPDPEARDLERLLLGLRTSDGLPLDEPRLAARPEFLEHCEVEGWARREADRWALTPTGWLRLDGILARLAS